MVGPMAAADPARLVLVIGPEEVLVERALERIRREVLEGDPATEVIELDGPSLDVGRFLELAVKAKNQKISTVSLVPPLVNTGDPDMAEVHEMVALGIDRSEGDAPAPEQSRKKKNKAPSSTTGGSLGSMSEGYAANQAADLGTTC